MKEYNDVIASSSLLNYVFGVVSMLAGAFLVLLPNIIKKKEEEDNEEIH